MSITVKCPSCAVVLNAPDKMLGRTTKCPKCAKPVTVGAIAPAPLPVAAVYVPPPEAVAVDVAQVDQTKECPYCGESVRSIAKKCKHCGETIDVTLRVAEEAKRVAERMADRPDSPSAPMVFMNAGGASSSSSSSSAAAVVSARPYRRRSAQSFPHLLHLILTFFTCGGWLPIWILHYAVHSLVSSNGSFLGALTGILLAVCILFGGFAVLISLGNGHKPVTTVPSPSSANEKSVKPVPEEEADLEKNPLPDQQAKQRAKEEAREEAKRKADEKRMEAQRKNDEEKAAANLRFAMKLVRDNQPEKAKQRLKEIIQEFPGTEAAKESRELLEQLER